VSEENKLSVMPEDVEALKAHAKIVAASGLVPEHFKKHPAAIYTAVGIARSMGEDPIHVCQNIYFVGGKPGWTSSFLLARLRRTKTIRGTVRYDIEDTEKDGITVRARAIDAETGDEIIGPAATMRMAEDDKWVKNPKYRSMPEIMLRNRALAFLVRYQYPEVLAGLPMAEELQDVAAAVSVVPAERTGALASIEAQVSDEKLLETGRGPTLEEALEDELEA
jgi:hypothetical protein